MPRAHVVNAAADTGAGGSAPVSGARVGRIDLDAVLYPGQRRAYVDQTVLLTDPGEEHRVDLRVADLSAPTRVTLVWTDPPGPVGSGTATVPAVVNRLHLTVTVDGQTYHGNVLHAGWSVPDEELDAGRRGLDTVQNVRLPGGAGALGRRRRGLCDAGRLERGRRADDDGGGEPGPGRDGDGGAVRDVGPLQRRRVRPGDDRRDDPGVRRRGRALPAVRGRPGRHSLASLGPV